MNTGNNQNAEFTSNTTADSQQQQSASDDVLRVDVEPMHEAQTGYTRTATEFFRSSFSLKSQPFPATGDMIKPPFITTWLALALAWVCLGSKMPFTVLIGIPLNIVALLLAAVCLSRGAVRTSGLVFLLGTGGSVVVYIAGLFRFLSSLF